jgi:hypothetical protein
MQPDYRLRQYLLALAAFTLAATVVELLLQEHTQEALQLVPVVLSIVGFTSVIGALMRPRRFTLVALRFTMSIVGLVGVLGTVIHLWRNLTFEQEIRSSAAVSDLLLEALKGGAPLLAPGVMVFAALAALLATYYHPLLSEWETP